MRGIQDLNFKNIKNIFVRTDIDVAIDNETHEIETFRLDKSLKTLKYIIDNNAKPYIAGHMGKPQNNEESLSTNQLKPYFDKHLGENTYVLLENLKFDSREKQCDMQFAQELAKDMDAYVNESFATSHRSYTSIVELPQILPAYAGFRLQEEIQTLTNLLNNPTQPLIAIIGGAKIESKLPTINTMLKIADKVLVGGKIGLNWKESIDKNLILPIDYAENNLDIGQKTIDMYTTFIKDAKSIVWAGPMGLFEDKKYAKGTNAIAKTIAQSEAYSIIGGGDTINAVNQINLLDNMNFVSTGGSAMLEFIGSKSLVGILALENKS